MAPMGHPCHWSCQRCTERLGYVLTGQALTVLHGLAGEAPRPTLVTLTISPPPGIKLSELRQAVEEVDSANGGHAIWGLKIQDKGRATAYMLTTTGDPKLLERQARDSVHGDSRSAKFTPVRGSDLAGRHLPMRSRSTLAGFFASSLCAVPLRPPCTPATVSALPVDLLQSWRTPWRI
jgi:hypothetical protein